MKGILKAILVLIVFVFIFSGCASDADIASKNISTAADKFQIDRRIVFYNGITDNYILVIEGKCSLGNYDDPGELSVTCKVGEDYAGKGLFKKHYLGLSDNVTYFSEQIDGVPVNVYHYKVFFKPEVIIPDIDLQIEE